jgi:hypothetical protein
MYILLKYLFIYVEYILNVLSAEPVNIKLLSDQSTHNNLSSCPIKSYTELLGLKKCLNLFSCKS